MSRIGYNPIALPDGVEIQQQDSQVVVKGPKGELSVAIPEGITVSQEERNVIVKRDQEE